MGPAVPSSSAFGRSGSTLGKLGALFGESSGSCVSEPMESAFLQVLKLLLEAAVSKMALGATPEAETSGSAGGLLGILRRIVLGTTRVHALRERVLALKAVGAHATTWCQMAVLAGGGSTDSRLLGGGGAD